MSRSGGYSYLIAFLGIELTPFNSSYRCLNDGRRFYVKRLNRPWSALDGQRMLMFVEFGNCSNRPFARSRSEALQSNRSPLVPLAEIVDNHVSSLGVEAVG